LWREATADDERRPLMEQLDNSWRKAKGPPLLPVPEVKEVVKVREEQVAALLDEALRAVNAAKRSKSLAVLEAKGSGSLPAVQRKLKEIGERHPAHTSLANLAGRLASIVREVHVSVNSVPPNAAIRETVRSLEGQACLTVAPSP
jgi:hypothetical protein